MFCYVNPGELCLDLPIRVRGEASESVKVRKPFQRNGAEECVKYVQVGIVPPIHPGEESTETMNSC